MFKANWVGVVCLLAIAGCGPAPEAERSAAPPRPVKVVRVADYSDTARFTLPGQAVAAREVNLAFEVPGKITLLPVKAGDRVEKGDLIAQLNQEAYRARMEAAEARYKQASNDIKRMSRLLASNNLSQTAYDAAQLQLDVASSQYALQQKEFQDTSLTAPFSGIVAATYVDNYTHVSASLPVARLVDISRVEFAVDIPETLARSYSSASDYRIRIEFDAHPGKLYDAQLKEMSLEASRKTRTFPASFVMSQPSDFTVYAGMSGRAHIDIARTEVGLARAIAVPFSAVFTPQDQKQSHLWLVRDGRVVAQAVTVGKHVGAHIEVVEGLSPGDEVVVAGVHSLVEGQLVKSLSDMEH